MRQTFRIHYYDGYAKQMLYKGLLVFQQMSFEIGSIEGVSATINKTLIVYFNLILIKFPVKTSLLTTIEARVCIGCL